MGKSVFSKVGVVREVNASALFLSITVSLIVSVILTAFFLLRMYQQQFVIDTLLVKKLTHNMDEAIEFTLHNYSQFEYEKPYVVDLFNDQEDSVLIIKNYWGWYDHVMLTTFDSKDSLKKTIQVGTSVFENANREALYVAHNSELISINNDSYIKGNVHLPYKGYKSKNGLLPPSMPTIAVLESASQLPSLQQSRLLLMSKILAKLKLPKEDLDTFFHNLYVYGNVVDCSSSILPSKLGQATIIYSNKLLILNENLEWNNVLVYAPTVEVKSGFSGSVQLVCSDSIVVENNCKLKYPSTLTLIKLSDDSHKKITIGSDCEIAGGIVAYDQKPGFNTCYVDAASNTIIKGVVYSKGLLDIKANVWGSVYATTIKDGADLNSAGTIWIDALKTSEMFGNPILFQSDPKYIFVQ